MSKAKDDTIAQLLQQSAPRPTPSADQVAAARAALRDEWYDVSSRHRAGRRLRGLALAASVLLAAFVAVRLLQGPIAPIVPVATIDRTFGTVYLLGERAELRPTNELETILSGQTIVTGHDAGLAVTWGNGGSIRIDEDTRIRFVDPETAFLDSGRLYFDSSPGLAARTVPIDSDDAPAFTLQTNQGEVVHVGTQFMADTGESRLVVSVREGEVLIAGRYHELRVGSGQQATLAGAKRPQLLSVGRSGRQWEWIERTTPAVEVDGHSLHEFLAWVTRELGLDIRYEGDAEAVARGAVLRGRIDTSPAEALRLRLATAALDWRIEKGVIYISD